MFWEMLKAGNIHPALVHFPLVLMLLAWGAQTLAWISHKEQWQRNADLLLILTAVAALITAATGYWAADQLGHETPGHEMVHAHRDVMVSFTILAVLTALLLLLKRLKAAWLRWLIFTILTAILILGADRGAGLVFRYGMGVKMVTSSAHEEGGAVHSDENSESKAHNHSGDEESEEYNE